MKRKENFVLRRVADTWVILPLAEQTLNFDGMLTLNDSGAMLWKLLEPGSSRETLAQALTEEYEVSYEQALCDVDAFLAKLLQAGCAEAEQTS